MTLTDRLTLFLVATLAAVLVGFSATLFLLGRQHLYAQADERLEAALNTLAAAAEDGPGGVEWEPGSRTLAVGPRGTGDRLAWAVTDPTGAVVARSDRADADDLLTEAAGRLTGDPAGGRRMHWQGGRWLIGLRRLRATDPQPVPPRAEEPRYPELIVTAAVPLAPVRAMLHQLAWYLGGGSAGVLAAAALAGRAVCRRALRPVRVMADAARAGPADDPTYRLPVGPARDELADLGGAFNGLLDRLAEASERQRRFTAEASHQLRTPLTALIGQVEVALRRDRPPAEYRQALAAARGEAGRLRGLVETLLFLARADADAVVPDRERLDLAAWLPGQLRPWAAHPRAGDLHATADSALWLEVPPLLLGELMSNLIDNAFKYSPEGTPVSLRAVAGPGDGTASVEVEDRGYGITPDDLGDLFLPFVRTADARRRGVPGVGLGLTVAVRLAAACGGTLEVESEPGRGSVFRVRLPRTSPPTEDVPENGSTPSAANLR